MGRTSGRQQGAQPMQWVPALDVLHEDGDLLIRAELPGVQRADVEITLHERALTTSGERRAEEQREGSGYYVRERRHGSYCRTLVLPNDVEEGMTSVRFEDGVLEVKVPGGAAVRAPKRIQIQGGASSEGAGT